VVPARNARSPARWITGPSAIGSENGTPSSIKSAPPRSSASISAACGRRGIAASEIRDEPLTILFVQCLEESANASHSETPWQTAKYPLPSALILLTDLPHRASSSSLKFSR